MLSGGLFRALRCRKNVASRFLSRPTGIYVNNQVDLKSCEIFGFDYDYTLAEYKGI